MDSDYFSLGTPATPWTAAPDKKETAITNLVEEAELINPDDGIQQSNLLQSAYVNLSTKAQQLAENVTLYQAKNVCFLNF
jgi:hypothetical protein